MKTEETIRAAVGRWETRKAELEEMHARGASWHHEPGTPVGVGPLGSYDLADRLSFLCRAMRWILEEDPMLGEVIGEMIGREMLSTTPDADHPTT